MVAFVTAKYLSVDKDRRATKSLDKGVFLVSAKNAFVPVKRDNSMNTYSRISTVPRGSERSE